MRVATSIFRPLWHHHNTAEERKREMEEGGRIRWEGRRTLVIVGSHSQCLSVGLRRIAGHFFLPAARYEHAGLHVHFVLPFFLLPSFEKAQRSI